jgi:Outer membrane protein beta-barrel domain
MRKSLVLHALFVVILAVIGFSAKAQSSDMNLYAGGNLILAFPAGDFSNGYTYGAGAEGSLGFGITSKLYVLGTLGYISYKNEDGNLYGKIRYVPIKAGLRLYPGKNFYVAANAGIGLLKDEAMTSSESRFAYDAGVGIQVSVLQFGVHYDAWQRKNTPGASGALQVKVGLVFK